MADPTGEYSSVVAARVPAEVEEVVWVGRKSLLVGRIDRAASGLSLNCSKSQGEMGFDP